ncbi:MAG: Asp-tRNA(Asn)/Glu-tRNA(Gln) amidotransferase subunit GatA [Verrucomicrobiota bacterium]
MHPADLTLVQAREQLRAKELSPSELLDALVERIEERDPQVRAYLSYDLEQARSEAEKADLSLPLGGLPIGIKDVLNVQGHPCHCASKILKGYIAPYDATAIRKLREAGGIPFGRLNMDEFAMGSSTENSGFHPTANPHDLERVPGGSSGGSAAAVAGGMALATLGSDTGGSIRQPASFCGVVGMKPTYGRVSRYGLVAYASSLDQIGPFTKTVSDTALLLEALCGPDPKDSTCFQDQKVPAFSQQLDAELSGLKIGVPKEYMEIDGLAPAVKESIQQALTTYESLGCEIIEISLPHTEYAVATYYIAANAEASSNLARFDGVRYGHRSAHADSLLEQYQLSREEGFGDEVKRRIILGTYVLSSGYYDAYYNRAQKVRTLIRQDFEKAFEQVDLIAGPTSPCTAFKMGDRLDDPVQMYLADVLTIPVNLAGTCALSVPCGVEEVDGKSLPIGLQLIGKPLEEAALLAASAVFHDQPQSQKEATF